MIIKGKREGEGKRKEIEYFVRVNDQDVHGVCGVHAVCVCIPVNKHKGRSHSGKKHKKIKE